MGSLESNKVLVLQKKLEMRFEQRSIPLPGADDVLLKILSVGICGSDVHYWADGACGRFVVKDPLVLGHETCAQVVSVGSSVTHLKAGDRVAVEPGVPCRRCQLCTAGRYNLCPEMRFHATPPVDGTLAHYVVHPADFCFKLPESVSNEEGALLEPLAVAVYACRRTGVSVGSRVLICGAGPIGLATLLTAKALGAASIAITDVLQSRLDFAKTLGANHVELVGVKGKKDEDHVTSIEEGLGGPPQCTIECAGPESSIRLAVKATGPRGAIATVGRGPQEPTLPLHLVTVKEISINGVFRYANCFPAALALVLNKSVPVGSLVSHRFTFEDSLKAFELAHKGEGIKIMINVGNEEKRC